MWLIPDSCHNPFRFVLCVVWVCGCWPAPRLVAADLAHVSNPKYLLIRL